MGCSQRNSCSISPDPFSSDTSSPLTDQQSPDNPKSKNLIKQKMIFEFGLSCFLPPSKTATPKNDENDKDNSGKILEHNKAWLLADSGGCGAELTHVDPQSIQSSFRFTFCSQIELESMKVNDFCSATVLVVNLDNGFTESGSREVKKWSRIESLERNISPLAHNLVRFSYSEILSATCNFSKDRVLGRGALSCVFRGKVGFLRKAVAIKRLDKEDTECSKAFCRELMIASSLHNPFIVPLVGFCIGSEGDLFLVYKYISCGSLEQYLHEKKRKGKGNSSLTWSMRYKIAVGIAKAVGYLHNGTERCVVHRDIKPSNILLSSRKTPKLCDFGLATWTRAPSVPFLCKTVKGTFGYLAPEYFQHGKISDKTDVYALGVVLLELITGRKPIETRTGEENLLLWAKPFLQQGAIEGLIDPHIKFSRKNLNHISPMVQAAGACIVNEEFRRPNINEIISILTDEKPKFSNKRNFSLPTNAAVADCHSQLQQSKSEMKNHLALAMLGVPEFEVDDQKLKL